MADRNIGKRLTTDDTDGRGWEGIGFSLIREIRVIRGPPVRTKEGFLMMPGKLDRKRVAAAIPRFDPDTPFGNEHCR